MDPQISIVMPVFNAAPYLKEALESIQHQTFQNWELIALNDGSTDTSGNILKSFSNDPRIRIVEHDINCGIVHSLNEAIGLSRGEFIARMDADDISMPQRLELQWKYMSQHPEVVVCGTSYFLLKNQRKIKMHPAGTTSDFLKTQLLFSTPFCHPTVMIRITKAGNDLCYNEEFRHAEDYELWTRLASKGDFHILPNALYIYRDHPHQVSHLQFKTQLQLKNQIRKIFAEQILGSVNEDLLEGLNLAGNNILLKNKSELKKIYHALLFLSQSKSVDFLSHPDGQRCLAKFWSDSCSHHTLGLYPIYEYLKNQIGVCDHKILEIIKILIKIVFKSFKKK